MPNPDLAEIATEFLRSCIGPLAPLDDGTRLTEATYVPERHAIELAVKLPDGTRLAGVMVLGSSISTREGSRD